MKAIKNYFILLLLFSCSTENKSNDYNINILVEVAQSYKYDLANDLFTVFYLSKPSKQLKVELTDKEKKELINKFYDFKIKKNTAEMKIEDKCLIMPKLYTRIYVKSEVYNLIIQIDESCNQFNSKNQTLAKEVKGFLALVRLIFNSKPEVKSLSKSDIFYL